MVMEFNLEGLQLRGGVTLPWVWLLKIALKRRALGWAKCAVAVMVVVTAKMPHLRPSIWKVKITKLLKNDIFALL
jgi:hypothetical protein